MISIVMLSKNSSETIKGVLEALKDFDEIILLDTGSTDNTLEIAKTFQNVKIQKSTFYGFGALRNEGAKLAFNNWILAIDSDEIIPKDLKDELLSQNLDPKSIYGFYFHNYYNEKLIKCCGWHPEKHLRLYNKNTTQFSEDLVHEKIIEKDLNKVLLKNPIKHFPYRKTDDFLLKMSKYTTLFASQYKNKKKSSLFKAIVHGLFAFFKSYIIKKKVF